MACHLSSVAALLDKWESLVAVHSPISPGDRLCLERLVEGLKIFQARKLSYLSARANDAPVLDSYGSDSTPIMTLERFIESGGIHRVLRKGKKYVDFLLQQRWVLCETDEGEILTVVLFKEPLVMNLGKDQKALNAAFRDFYDNARDPAHEGILVRAMQFDLAMFEPMCRLIEEEDSVRLRAGLYLAGR